MNEGSFKSIAQFNVGHSSMVTGIHHSPGTLYTCSSDRTIKVESLMNLNNNLAIDIVVFTCKSQLLYTVCSVGHVAFWIVAGSPSMCTPKDSLYTS